MPSMERFDRRSFLARLAAAGLAPALHARCGGEDPPNGDEYWVSGHGESGDAPGLVAVQPSLGAVTTVPTGFRGHDVAQHPTRPHHVVLFGRRPGTESVVVDVLEGRVVRRFTAGEGRGFQGHGFFTADGRWLITSEADLQTAAGRLGVRETEHYDLVDERDTFGLGPHEVQLMPDGATVVIANGGLLTRPETGREVLNLDTMDSTLTYVDLSSGELHDQHRLDGYAKASIRHLDTAADGSVFFGVQVQRTGLDDGRTQPLGGVHRRGQAIRLLDDGLGIYAAMNAYVGSVAVSPELVGLSSPRGNLCAFWQTEDGALLGYHQLNDCCGLAVALDRRTFVLSSSTGEVRTLDRQATEVREARRRLPHIRFDNHLKVISLRGVS